MVMQGVGARVGVGVGVTVVCAGVCRGCGVMSCGTMCISPSSSSGRMLSLANSSDG